MNKIPSFVVSLPESRADFVAVAAQLNPEIFEVHAPIGLPGRTLPDGVCLQLTRDPNSVNNKGALGCILSHVRVWDAVAAMDVPYALVLEDDVIGYGLERVAHLQMPTDFDLVFCNDRTAFDRLSSGGTPDATIEFAGIADALSRIEARGLSIGSDAYFISPRGARRLIDLHARDLYFGHVDCRLLAYCIDTAQLAESLQPGRLTAELLRIRRIINHQPPLIAYYCTSALFTHVGKMSRRVLEDAEGKRPPARLGRSGFAPQTIAGESSPGLARAAEANLFPYRSWGRIRNIGDDMMPFIMASLLGHVSIRVGDQIPHTLGSGSIIYLANTNSLIWGSGLLNRHSPVPDLQAQQVRAVRGDLTASALTRHGVKLPDIPFGDPGIFAAEIVAHFGVVPGPKPRRIAVVPHHYFCHHAFFGALWKSEEVAVIEPFDNSLAFFRKILESDVVISQSLHGLIIGEALGKPTVWISANDDEHWNFKFRDWFSTTEIPQLTPLMFKPGEPVKDLQGIVDAACVRNSRIDKVALRRAIPDEASFRSSAGRGDFQELRAVLPLIAFVDVILPDVSIFEELPSDRLGELRRSALAGLDSAFRHWPERGYCCILTPGYVGELSRAHQTTICRIMDQDVRCDFISIVQRRFCPEDIETEHFGYGVHLAGSRKLFGTAFCVRADFAFFTTQFRTVIIDG